LVVPFDGECHGAVAGSIEADLGQGNGVGQDVDVEVLAVGGAQRRHGEAHHRQDEVQLEDRKQCEAEFDMHICAGVPDLIYICINYLCVMCFFDYVGRNLRLYTSQLSPVDRATCMPH
jgi:hypothetical protein